MAKTTTTKKLKKQLVKYQHRITLVLIVGLCVGVGAFFLPRMFAQSPTGPVTPNNLAIHTESNGIVVFLWGPKGQGGTWQTQVNGGTATSTQDIWTHPTENRLYTRFALATCGINYSFNVRHLKNGAAGPWQAVNASYACPTVAIRSFTASGGTATATWAGSFNGGPLVYSADVNGVFAGTSGATSHAFPIACGTNYRITVTPRYSVGSVGMTGQVGAASLTAPACPPAYVPPAATLTAFTASGNSVTAAWTGKNASSYDVYLASGSGSFAKVATQSGLTYKHNGSCNTKYSLYVVPRNTQPGAKTETRSVTTAACPSSGGGGSTGGGGTGGGGTGGGGTSTGGGKTKTGGGSSTPAPAPAAWTGPPETPQNFAAEIISGKIVELTWSASGGADHYIISRSTDGNTWEQIAESSSTVYDDESAAFETTYYYQIYAVGSDGLESEKATTQISTEQFSQSSNVITSEDKRVTVTIPDGAIEGSYNCSVTSDQEQATDLIKVASGSNSKVLAGPYALVCVTESGEVIEEFAENVSVVMSLKGVADGYQDIVLRALTGDWQKQQATYDQTKQQLSFELASIDSFAATGVKPAGGSIWKWLLPLLLLIILGIVGFLFWRRRRSDDAGYYYDNLATSATAPVAAAATVMPSAQDEFREAVAKPDCTHLAMAQQVVPSGEVCAECQQTGATWTSLRICLLCGNVACSDDSTQQHARKHYEQTGHPLIYEYGNPTGNTIGWCYIDETYI